MHRNVNAVPTFGLGIAGRFRRRLILSLTVPQAFAQTQIVCGCKHLLLQLRIAFYQLFSPRLQVAVLRPNLVQRGIEILIARPHVLRD